MDTDDDMEPRIMLSTNCFMLLFGILVCVLAAGCPKKDQQMPDESPMESQIPDGVLAPDSLETLGISVSHDARRSDTLPQPLNFPADSPEAGRARQFLVNLLADKERRRLPLGSPARLTVRFGYLRERASQGPAFSLAVEPFVGNDVVIYMWEKPGAEYKIIRRFSCDERLLKEVNELWELFERSASTQKKQ